MKTVIEVDDAEVKAALAKLAGKIENPRPLLLEIGEELTESTLKRFSSSTAPDGSKWQANSALTILRSGQGKGKKPLIGESKSLSTQIHYELAETSVVVGSSMIYARVQQQGAKMGEFGRYYQLSRQKYGEKDFRRYAGMKKGHPLPWGDIPARPFLGVSQDDRDMITRSVLSYLQPE
jgi:phage virion morphogenesis protein